MNKNLTRRNFIKMALLSTSIIPVINLTGCEICEDLSYDVIKGQIELEEKTEPRYKIVIYDIPIDEISKKYRDIEYDIISELEGRHAMLIYYNIKYFWNGQTVVYKWQENGWSLQLMYSKGTLEEVKEEFQSKYGVIEEFDALSVFIDKYGIKDEYTVEEIKEIITEFEEKYKENAYQKTKK